MAVYKETQYLAPVIRWGGMAFGAIMISIGIFGAVKGISEDGWISLAVSLFVGPLAVAMILFMRLEFKLSTTGITYRLFPLEWKDRKINLEDVESIKIYKLKKLGGYGGFGKRRKPWRKEIAYILNRNYGLTVRLKNGRVRVFSTENEKKLKTFIQANLSHLTQQNENNEKV